MKYWKNKIIYDSESNELTTKLVEIEGSEIEYHMDRMNELVKRQNALNETFFRSGMRYHIGEITKILDAEEKAEKEIDDE